MGSLGAGVGLWESAEVRVNPTGNVEVLTGSHSHGQGHETTFAQLVSARLGIPIDQVSVIHGDTDKVQFGMAPMAQRSGAVGMSAIVKRWTRWRPRPARSRPISSKPRKATSSSRTAASRWRARTGASPSPKWRSTPMWPTNSHLGIEPGLKEGAFYDPTNFTFPAGCHICELEVDPETGVTEIVKWVAVDDFGTVINPMIVEGRCMAASRRASGRRSWSMRSMIPTASS